MKKPKKKKRVPLKVRLARAWNKEVALRGINSEFLKAKDSGGFKAFLKAAGVR